MKIVSTFAVVKESLYSVQYEDEDTHELARLFRLWNDAEYLEDFFNEHLWDLKRTHWGNISVEQAILKTRKDARLLENKIIDTAKTGKTDKNESLSTLFRPLYDHPTMLDPFEKSKASGFQGYGKPSWLRIYAIRLDLNLFVVSGGGIKLTQNLNNREHLIKELEKLELTKKYCKEKLGSDNEEFFELL